MTILINVETSIGKFILQVENGYPEGVPRIINFTWPVTYIFCRGKFINTYLLFFPVDQAGSERTEAGESAPSRLEDSPRPGRAKCELCETLQDLIMGAGEEASLNLPCLLILAPSWIARPSHSYSSELQATRGTLC